MAKELLLRDVENGRGTAGEKPKKIRSLAIFLIVILPFIMLQSYASGHFDGIWGRFCYILYLFSPAIACVIARICSKEGFRDGILWPRFLGNGKAYLLAILWPLAIGLLGGILAAFYLGAGLSVKMEGGWKMAILNFLLYSDYAYYVALITAGEELGWRAFLYDKLEDLLGLDLSLIVGGIIWGLWHFPVLYFDGINFGKDYPGFPVLGIVLMCLICVFMGAPMQLVRKLSGSVIPAIVIHGIVDSVMNFLLGLFLTTEYIEGHAFALGVVGLVIPTVILGIPAWILLHKK